MTRSYFSSILNLDNITTKNNLGGYIMATTLSEIIHSEFIESDVIDLVVQEDPNVKEHLELVLDHLKPHIKKSFFKGSKKDVLLTEILEDPSVVETLSALVVELFYKLDLAHGHRELKDPKLPQVSDFWNYKKKRSC